MRQKRSTRRSGDSIELQPLHTSGAQPKGVLRRMSRVRSDDLSHPNNDTPSQTAPPISEPPVSSPLGAGLPLLSRLRLLKEKQVSMFYYSINYYSNISLTYSHRNKTTVAWYFL